MAVKFYDKYAELEFKVYSGDTSTLPEDSANNRLLIALYDSEEIRVGFRNDDKWVLTPMNDKEPTRSMRISIGDHWAQYPIAKNLKCVPQEV